MATCSRLVPSGVVVADNDPGALELVVTDLRLEGHEIVARCSRRRVRHRAVPRRAARRRRDRPSHAPGAARARGGAAPGHRGAGHPGHRVHQLPGHRPHPGRPRLRRHLPAEGQPASAAALGRSDGRCRLEPVSRRGGGSRARGRWMSPLPSTPRTPSAAAWPGRRRRRRRVQRITIWLGCSPSTMPRHLEAVEHGHPLVEDQDVGAQLGRTARAPRRRHTPHRRPRSAGRASSSERRSTRMSGSSSR